MHIVAYVTTCPFLVIRVRGSNVYIFSWSHRFVCFLGPGVVSRPTHSFSLFAPHGLIWYCAGHCQVKNRLIPNSRHVFVHLENLGLGARKSGAPCSTTIYCTFHSRSSYIYSYRFCISGWWVYFTNARKHRIPWFPEFMSWHVQPPFLISITILFVQVPQAAL